VQSLKQYQETQTGAFAGFPFGAFAFARLDERLKGEPVWRDATQEKGLDPMNMYPDQAHVEFMHINVSGLDKAPYRTLTVEKMLSGHLTGLPDPQGKCVRPSDHWSEK
jgi:hypothetical protein